jgi:tetratricopeptide (TPR) repeat protein
LTPAWISGVGVITVAGGIGVYLYFQKPVYEPKIVQKSMFSESSPSFIVNSAPQKIPQVQENLQEANIKQVLELAEDKFWQVKNRAAKLSPKQGNRRAARVANDRGLAHLQGGRIADAIYNLQQAYRANPADIEIVNNLGYAYLLNNDPVAAENYLLMALTMQPERSAAWGNLGQTYVKKGQTAEGVASFSNAYRFSRDLKQTHSYFLAMMEKENDGNLKQALRQATQVGEKWYMKK